MDITESTGKSPTNGFNRLTMHRITANEWRTAYYSGKQIPSLAKIKRQINRGELPGTQVAQTTDYIIYCDENYEPKWPEFETPQQPPEIKSDIAAKILQKYNQ